MNKSMKHIFSFGFDNSEAKTFAATCSVTRVRLLNNIKIGILFTVLFVHFKISASIEDYQFMCAMIYALIFILSIYILEAQGDF